MPILCDLRINGKTIATVEIRNDGMGTEELANYDVILAMGETRSVALGEGFHPVDKMARVLDFDRSLGAVELLRQSLNALHDNGYPQRSEFDAR